MSKNEIEIDEKVHTIKRLCQLILELMHDERRAIYGAEWAKLDSLVRRKGKLLQKMESVGFEQLNALYIFDKRVVQIRDMIQEIVGTENENANLLKTQMQTIKDNLSRVKHALQSVVYSQPVVLESQFVKQR